MVRSLVHWKLSHDNSQRSSKVKYYFMCRSSIRVPTVYAWNCHSCRDMRTAECRSIKTLLGCSHITWLYLGSDGACIETNGSTTNLTGEGSWIMSKRQIMLWTCNKVEQRIINNSANTISSEVYVVISFRNNGSLGFGKLHSWRVCFYVQLQWFHSRCCIRCALKKLEYSAVWVALPSVSGRLNWQHGHIIVSLAYHAVIWIL